MPKNAKKRKEKAADFSKAKLKLGKARPLPSNLIHTSFKARSIALPTQSLTQEKHVNAYATKRKLTFDDLLLHAKHYSATVRKDAILGFRELLEAHDDILDASLTPLINACVRLVGDEDANVRRTLLGFFAWLLPRIPYEDVLPHSKLLLLFTTSAQTHIFPEIRIDAVRFLNLFLEHIPDVVVSGWNDRGHGARVLEGFLGILNVGSTFGETDGPTFPAASTSSSSVMLSPASKHIILQSLSKFLQLCLSDKKLKSIQELPNSVYLRLSSDPLPAHVSFRDPSKSLSENSATMVYRAWIEDEGEFDEFGHPFLPTSSRLWSSADASWDLWDLTEGIRATANSADADVNSKSELILIARLAKSLHPVLLATFLDCAPTVFSPSVNPSETDVQMILAVGRIIREICGFISKTSERACHQVIGTFYEGLAEILGHMTPYFPFGVAGTQNIRLEEAFQELNLIFCELVSLQVAASTDASPPARRGKSGQSRRQTLGSKHGSSVLIPQVGEYIVHLFRGEAAEPSLLGKPLSQAASVALQPTVWALFNTTAAENISVAILQAAIDHSIKTSCKSAVKASTIDFIARLVMLHQLENEPLRHGRSRFLTEAGNREKLEEWLDHLPQALWELGVSNLAASELILRFLLRVLQRRSCLGLGSQVLTSFRVKLEPYFSFEHAVRGHLAGPFIKLPSATVQRLALDVAVHLLEDGGEDENRLRAAVDFAVAKTQEQQYWLQIQKHYNLHTF